MIYRNKIERENRRQLYLTRCLWFALMGSPKLRPSVATSQTPETLGEIPHQDEKSI